MDKSFENIINLKINKTIEALEKNNMNGYYAQNREEALKLVENMISPNDTVTHGGSVTLAECGIPNLLKNGGYNYLDRSAPGLTTDDINKIYRDTFFADVYLTSSNVVTLNGELYNVDGNSNRVSAMLFGPKKVIVVVGYNKLVGSIDEAVQRVKCIAAPANCVRLNKNTYCSKKGECVSVKDSDSYICSGCSGEDRICRNYVVMGTQSPAVKGRVNVIIVGEELGY